MNYSDVVIGQSMGRFGRDTADMLFGTGRYAPVGPEIEVIAKSDYLNDMADKNILIKEQNEVIEELNDEVLALHAHIAGLNAQLDYLKAENPKSNILNTLSNMIGEDGKKMSKFQAIFEIARKKFFDKNKNS